MRYSALDLIAAPAKNTSDGNRDIASEPAHQAVRHDFEQLVAASPSEPGSATEQWDEVIDDCERWLRRSNDLRPATIIAIAWTRLDGERGLEAGLRLVAGLIGRQRSMPLPDGETAAAMWASFFSRALSSLQALGPPSSHAGNHPDDTAIKDRRQCIDESLLRLQAVITAVGERLTGVAADACEALRQELIHRAQGLDRADMEGAGVGAIGLDIRVDRAMQQALLRRILGENGRDDAVVGGSSRALDALRAVADRHRGQPFSLNPVTIDLVEETMNEWFQPALEQRPAWRVIAGRVARTLYDDPRAHERLAAMWQRLALEPMA